MSIENRPLVSVIIPSYNRSKKILPAVRSVLNQTYGNLELIIVDDGSTDDTSDVVKNIVDERVHYVYQDNAGACAARNKGVSLAKGDLIAFQDSDDIWHENKLQKQVEKLLTTGSDVVLCKLILFENGERKYLLPKRVREGIVTNKDDIFGFGTQTILAKREVFEKEMFDSRMPRLQELEWMLRVIRQFRVYCIDEGMVDYVIGSDSITGNPEKLYRALKIIIGKYPDIKKESPLLAMHAFKDLLENKERVKEYNVDQDNYRKLTRHWFPGAIRYLSNYISQIAIPKITYKSATTDLD